MKRKVNLVGQNTLTVSLPSKWVKENDIKKGDEINFEESGKSMILSTKENSKKIKKIVITVDRFSKFIIMRHLHEFYRQGVDEVILKFSKSIIYDHKHGKEVDLHGEVKKIVDRFIGMEITSQKNDTIIIQNLMAKESLEKIETVERRVYYLIKEFCDEFVKSMDSDFAEFHKKSYDYHDNIAKFTYYYLRLLHISDMAEETKARLFGLFIKVDGVIDKIRHTSERVNEMKKITKKTKDTVKEIFDLFIQMFDMILEKNFEIEEVEKIVKKRYELVHKVNHDKFTDEEYRVIGECKIMLDMINDFTETYAALHINRQKVEI